MNTPPSDTENSNNMKDKARIIRFGGRQVRQWAVYSTLAVLAAVMFVVIISLAVYSENISHSSKVEVTKELRPPVFTPVAHVATDNLINTLKQHGLWSFPSTREVPRFFIESYPVDLSAVSDVSIKKKVFLHSLLPHALFVRQEALQKRNRLESILSKVNCSLQDIYFDSEQQNDPQCSWSEYLGEEEESFIEELCITYRTTSAVELLERVDAVPTSIILAQGALESSWGSSRFTREGNSIFGMWTWKTKGIVPAEREEGKTHKVKVYENVLDSVRAYHRTLNRLEQYAHFRQLRLLTDDPLVIAEGLTLYSERGEDYVEDIKKVIESNNLQKYDSCSLSDSDPSWFSLPVTDNSQFQDQDKASL